jgi:long-chain acyl-CoA synthetase
MREHIKMTFPAQLAETVRLYGDRPAMAFVGEQPVTYNVLLDTVMSLMSFLHELGFNPGEKAGILSTNMPNWGMAYYAITFIGGVVVPLLPDFHQDEIENIINHSEAKLIFVSDNLLSRISSVNAPLLKKAIRIEDFLVINPEPGCPVFQKGVKPSKEFTVEENDLAALIYTSGTSGKSKGVMLSHKNITYTAMKSGIIQPIDENDRFLSVLPLSHTYENTLGLILPMLGGASIYYLGRPPTASILLPALKQVRPTLMLTVPLIIEKIYRAKILAAIREKWITRLLYMIPYTRKKMNKVAGKKLRETFGGQLKFFGIGGAKLNRSVEKFLIQAGFPYAIGYGLTESAPLLAGANPQVVKLQSTGPAMEGVDLKIHNPNPKTGEGEIWAKGPNVMQGYYKEPELTREVITGDGWLKTGDLGRFDNSGFLYIRGRLKTMIIGSGGENIYPEDIESVINNFRYVIESLVIEKKGKLIALVHFDQKEIEEKCLHLKDEVANYMDAKLAELKRELQEYVNARVNKFSRVQLILVHPEPFQKTATQKIKRFLYT